MTEAELFAREISEKYSRCASYLQFAITVVDQQESPTKEVLIPIESEAETKEFAEFLQKLATYQEIIKRP